MATTGKGSHWAPEWKTFKDPVSGAMIHQLTNYKCLSNHLYFTESGWYDGDRKLIIISDRENRTNLFGIDLESGEITQLTDLDPEKGRIGAVSKSPVREEAYFYHGDTLMVLDLRSLQICPLYTRPKGYTVGQTNATADGRYICTYHSQDLSNRFRIDLGHGYVGFREIFEAHPHSMIVKVDIDSGKSEVVFEENHWITHVNTSPKLPHILTFCHEGPWNLVEQRIWGLDINTGKSWKIRPQIPEEAIGHEYWMIDGEHIGYHGYTPKRPVYGAIRYDNTDQVEAPLTYSSTHFHSRMLDLIVGDGSRTDPYVLLWRYRNGQFEGPKVLAQHRGSFHIQRVHVHPRFSPDGKQVLYTADPQGYGQVFLADVPDFDSLPDRSSLPS